MEMFNTSLPQPRTKPKVLLVTASNLGPYHLARYEYLAKKVELTVIQTPVAEFHRPWQADFADISFTIDQPYADKDAPQSWRTLFRRTQSYLNVKQPDLLITVGYNRKYVWALTVTAHQLKIPAALYLVGWAEERQRSMLKEMVKRWYCRRYYNAAFVTGSRAAGYAEQLGIPADNVWRVGNVVDNNHFAQKGQSPEPLSGLGKSCFLTVTRLSDEKNIPVLLQAFAQYRSNGGLWHLAVAGTGPDEVALLASVPAALQEYVHWLGWVQYDALPGLYAHAGCFVLPSQIEPWGLVVNEAMAAGLPILISRQCGCYPELCVEGQNGFGFSPSDVGRLTELMHQVESLPEEERRRLGNRSSAIVAEYSLDSWRHAFVEAVNAITDSGPQHIQAE